MSYSKKDYNELCFLRDNCRKEKANFVNSFEVYMNFQLTLIRKYDLLGDALRDKHYLEWEKLTSLFHDYLIARKRFVGALCSLHAFKSYLLREYENVKEV